MSLPPFRGAEQPAPKSPRTDNLLRHFAMFGQSAGLSVVGLPAAAAATSYASYTPIERPLATPMYVPAYGAHEAVAAALNCPQPTITPVGPGGERWYDSFTRNPAPVLVSHASLLSSRYLSLQIVEGVPETVYKDSLVPVVLKLNHTGIDEGLWSASHSTRPLVRVSVALSDGTGKVVKTILNGPHAGHPILSHDVFDVFMSAETTLDPLQFRLREVSRTHSGGMFRLSFFLPDHRDCRPAITQQFYVRSERMRAPSYAASIRSRARRTGEGLGRRFRGRGGPAQRDAPMSGDGRGRGRGRGRGGGSSGSSGGGHEREDHGGQSE
jgi:hypothetical protein